MNLAEQIKNQINTNYPSFEKEYGDMLSEYVKRNIPLYGEAMFMCHDRVSRTKTSPIATVLPCHKALFKEWAERNGLRCYDSCNENGADALVVMI